MPGIGLGMVFGALFSAPGVAIAAQEIGAAGAAVGPFSSSNHWTRANTPWDLSLGTSVKVVFKRTGTTANQVICGSGDATHGWFLIHGNANNLLLFLRAGTPASVTLSGALYLGWHDLIVTRKLDGSLWFALDGGPDTLIHASPTYVAALAGNPSFIGYDTGEASFPGANTLVASLCTWNSELSSAERSAFTDGVNQLDRYALVPAATAHANLTSALVFDRDWDGSAATVTAGAGSAPQTFTKVGTGGGKTTLARLIRYRIQQEWMHDNGRWDELVIGVRRHSLFARTRFTTDATELVLDLYATNSGFVNQIDVGVKSNGTNQTGNHTGGAELDVYNKLRSVDITLPAGAGKAIEIIDGIQSLNTGTGDILGVFPQYIRVPETTPITPTFYTAPNRRLVVAGDSLTCQLTDASGNIQSCTYQAWPILARLNLASTVAANWTGCQVSLESYGSNSWKNIAGDSTKRAAFVARLAPMLDGTAGTFANRLVIALGTNDYGISAAAWVNLAAFETGVGTLLDDLHSAYPSLEITIIKPTTRLNEATNNASGYNLPGIRTSLGNVQSARSGWLLIQDGTAWVTVTNRDNDASQLHFEAAGHTEYESNFKTAMGY